MRSTIISLSSTSRRAVLAFAAALPVMMTSAPAFAESYDFVRIEGLAEQAVGEKLLKEVYRRAGIEITVTPMPGKRAIAEASAGKKDGETLRVYALGENVKTLLRVPTPLSSLETVAFAKSDSEVAVKEKDDLNNYDSVIVTGVLHTHAITEGVDNVNEVREPSKMFQLVQRGRADVALTSLLDGQAALRREGISDVVAIEPSLRVLELYHYVHESNAHLIPKIDAIIKEMTESVALLPNLGPPEVGFFRFLSRWRAGDAVGIMH